MSPFSEVAPVHLKKDREPHILRRSTLDIVLMAFVIVIYAMIKLLKFLENLLAIAFVEVTMGVHFVQVVAFGMNAMILHNKFRLWLFHYSLIEWLYIELMRHNALGKIW